jgi:hypothetical protein
MPKKSVAGSHADPTIQFSTLTIDDQKFSLCFSFNAIALGEHAAGCNLLNGLLNLQSGMSALELRGLLYAAMTVAKPDTTIEDAGKLIRLDTIGPVTMALAEAYSLSLPKKSVESEVASEAH